MDLHEASEQGNREDSLGTSRVPLPVTPPTIHERDVLGDTEAVA